MKGYEVKNMVDMNEIENFLAEVEAQAGSKTTPRYINRDRLVVGIDDESGYSEIHSGYILEGYTSGIEGQYGESTATRLISPEGRRMTLWLTGYEQEHLKAFLSNASEEGASFPMEVKFLRHKVLGTNGRKYNRFSCQLLSHGDALTVPPVPEDQYEDAPEATEA